MKIDSSIKPTTAAPSTRVKPQYNSEDTSTSAAPDEVRLSSLAGQLRASDAPPLVDSNRVQKIKQAIADGRFSINTGAIADRLIDSARELLNSQRRA